jgi:hypothetical protein
VRAPGGGDLGGFGGPAVRQSVEGDAAEAQAGIGDVDAAVVAVDVLQQAGRLGADGRCVLGPLAGGEPVDPPAQVVQDTRAPLEVVHARERFRVRLVARCPVVAGRYGHRGVGEDDLAWVAFEEPVREVPAEREGPVQPGLRAPQGQAAVVGDAVEHQPADHLALGGLGPVDHLVERGGVGLEFVGVGDQVPAGTGLLAQGVAELGVGVLVPRPGADLCGDDAEVVAGRDELVPPGVGDVVGKVEGEQEPLDAEPAVVGGPGGQQGRFDRADDRDQGGRNERHRRHSLVRRV